MAQLIGIVKKALKRHGITISELNKTLVQSLENRLTNPVLPLMKFKDAKKALQRAYFSELLTLNLGNISKAAQQANLNRRHIHRICTELEIDVDKIRDTMIKPSYYMTESVQEIIEENVDNFKEEIKPNKLVEIYTNLGEISKAVAQSIDTEIPTYEEVIESFEKEYFEAIFKETENNIERAAQSGARSTPPKS